MQNFQIARTPLVMPMQTPMLDRELYTSKITITCQPEFAARVNKFVRDTRALDRSKVIREAVEAFMNPRPIVTAHTGLDEIRLEKVGSANCGPYGEAVSDPKPFVITQDVADHLEAISQKDKVYTASGESMEGAGIADGAALLIRPYPGGGRPTVNKVALIQIFDEENNAESTVKRVVRWGNTPDKIELEDGDGNPFEIPAYAVRVEAVGAVKGLISTFDS